MKNNQKSIFHRIILGFKLGWKISTLPENIKNIHNHPLCRIFRVIGGICIFLVVTRHSPIFFSFLSQVFEDQVYIAIPVVIIALLHLCYIAVISFIRLRYIHYLFKTNKLEVRNSPIR